MKIIFKPWEDFKDDGENLKIKVDEPPCKHCVYWSPQKKYINATHPIFDGIELCTAREMHHDFSCYEGKNL